MLPLFLISYMFGTSSHIYIFRQGGFSSGMMSLPELLNFCASMWGSSRFLKGGLMNPLPLLSRNILRLSPLTLLMLIYKFNLPNCAMTNRLWIVMLLEGLKSKLTSIGWRLTIKLWRNFFRLFEPVMPILGLK